MFWTSDDIPFENKEYEGVRNVVGGSDIVHSAEVSVARRLHCWDCGWETRIWISETAEVSVARHLHCGITFGIQGLDFGNLGGEGRKTLAPQGLRLGIQGVDFGNLGGEDRKTLAPQGLRLESRGRISETAEVRVARLLHRGITFGIRADMGLERMSTGLEVKSRFLSVRLCGGPRVWLALWVIG